MHHFTCSLFSLSQFSLSRQQGNNNNMPRVYIRPTQRDCSTRHTVFPARQLLSTQRRNLSTIPLVAIEFSTTQKLYYWARYPSPEEYQESGFTTAPRIFSYQLTTFTTDQHSAEIAVSEMLSHYNTHKWFTEAQGLNNLISDLAKRICSSLPGRISSRLIQVTLPLHLLVEVFALYGNGDIQQLRTEISSRLHASVRVLIASIKNVLVIGSGEQTHVHYAERMPFSRA